MEISVCIATYNGEKYIAQQLQSILCQIGWDDEVIVSDDQSTDDTVKIIRKFNDSRIKVLSGKFGSPARNFENAISNAAGEIIILSDQDDYWLPKKVATIIEELKRCDLVVSNCYIGDENLNIIRDSYFSWRKSKTGFLKNVWRNSYLGCCIAFKKVMLSKLLPFPKNIPMHDMWIGSVAEMFYKPKFIDDRLMIYRRHSSNATGLTQDFKSKESYKRRMIFRVNLLRALISRMLKVYFK